MKPADVIRMFLGLLRVRVAYFLHEWPSGQLRTRAAVEHLVMALLLGTILVCLASVVLRCGYVALLR